MASEAQLKRWFNDFNLAYFDGLLAHEAELWWEPVSAAYATCTHDDGQFFIRINPAMRGWQSVAKWALLHEMVHMRLHPYLGHGKKFQAEMLRLAEAGAFKGIW